MECSQIKAVYSQHPSIPNKYDGPKGVHIRQVLQ